MYCKLEFAREQAGDIVSYRARESLSLGLHVLNLYVPSFFAAVHVVYEL